MILRDPKSLIFAVVTLAAALGCQGVIDEGPARPPGTPGAPGTPGVPTEPGEIALTPSPRLQRLTHPQWDRTVQDLLRLDASPGLATAFRADPRASGFLFDNNAESLEVDDALWLDYQRGAAAMASRLMDDRSALDRILPPGMDDEAHARDFIESFGARVHRRPLETGDVDAYLALWRSAPAVDADHSAFVAGVGLVLEAMLQSPYFLYRIESATDADGDSIPLDGWEVASRLSFTLWGTMPDDALFSAAAAGELSGAEAVATHARRMLDDDRARPVVAHFHHQLFETDKFAGIAPSAAFFPDAPAELPDLVLIEHDLFLEEIIFGRDGTYAQILTTPQTFVNAATAPIYGLEGSFSDEFELVSLDPTVRSGLFTHLGFLAANATSVDPDPIHRGVFLTRHIACNTLRAPPDDIPPLPAPIGMTNRETIEGLTEDPDTVCAGCHATIINPFGFPFESFDALGAHRATDNDLPIDTTAEPLLGTELVPITDAITMSEALATSEAVHFCYAEHWLEFVLGRPAAIGDEALIVAIAAESNEGSLSVKEMIVTIVSSPLFLERSTTELP